MSILDLKVFLRCRFQVETTWGFCARMGFVPSIRAKLASEDCGNMQGAQKMSGSRYWRFWTGLLKLYFGKGTWITPSDASTAPVGLGQSSQAQEPSTWRSHWHRTEEVWIVFHYDSWETLTPWLPISFTIPIAPRLQPLDSSPLHMTTSTNMFGNPNPRCWWAGRWRSTWRWLI